MLSLFLNIAACASRPPVHVFDTDTIRGAPPSPGTIGTLYINEFIDEQLIPGLLAVSEGLFARVEVQIGGELPRSGQVLVPDLEDVLTSPLRGEGVFQSGVLSVVYLTWRVYVHGELTREHQVQAEGRAPGPWANKGVMRESRQEALLAALERSQLELSELFRSGSLDQPSRGLSRADDKQNVVPPREHFGGSRKAADAVSPGEALRTGEAMRSGVAERLFQA